MIAIPNMDKPKSCDECVKSLDIECCGDIRDCPLIEIDQEAIDIAQDIVDGCKRFRERRNDESNIERD